MEKDKTDFSLLINTLKGFAIILVVIGHSIQSYSGGNFENIYFKLIYTFHMPLFMFLSGFVTVYSPTNSYSKLKKRFTRLVIPFLAWAVVYFVIKSVNEGEADFNFFFTLIKSVDNGLWFLWVLFLIHMAFYFSEILKKRVGSYSLLLVILLLQFTSFSFLGLGMLRYYVIFFAIGYYINNQRILEIINQHKYLISAISLSLFVLLFPLWKMNGEVDFFRKNIPFAVSLFERAYRISEALLAISFVFCLFLMFDFSKTKISWLGQKSLEIYCSHQYYFIMVIPLIALLPFKNVYLQTLFCSFILVVLSLATAYIIKKNKITNAIFFGVATKKDKN